MIYPSDDELEAMAVRLSATLMPNKVSPQDQAIIHNLIDAAEMLRACKGRQALEVDNARYNEALLIVGAYLVEKGEAFRVGEGAELLDAYSAALDPATDHSKWDAAIEAAAKVIDARKSVLEIGTELSDRVRALKKGKTND